jgi:hypothetical protein
VRVRRVACTQEQNPVEFVFESCEIPLADDDDDDDDDDEDGVGGAARGDGAGPAETAPRRTVHLKKTGGVLGLALIDGNMVQRVQVCWRTTFLFFASQSRVTTRNSFVLITLCKLVRAFSLRLSHSPLRTLRTSKNCSPYALRWTKGSHSCTYSLE